MIVTAISEKQLGKPSMLFKVITNVWNVPGLDTCTTMRLVQRNHHRKGSDTLSNFTGLGCITDITHHIKIASVPASSLNTG